MMCHKELVSGPPEVMTLRNVPRNRTRRKGRLCLRRQNHSQSWNTLKRRENEKKKRPCRWNQWVPRKDQNRCPSKIRRRSKNCCQWTLKRWEPLESAGAKGRASTANPRSRNLWQRRRHRNIFSPLLTRKSPASIFVSMPSLLKSPGHFWSNSRSNWFSR